MTAGTIRAKRIMLTEFIEEVAAAARLAAEARGVTFHVALLEPGMAIEADPQILAAVVTNLLQNAFKFTHPGSTVVLRVGASPDRLLIEIEDECGGLPEADAPAPSFEQRGVDRSGLGVGLAFSRWGAEANGGRLYSRNLPGTGCVFTVDLPRSTTPVSAPAVV